MKYYIVYLGSQELTGIPMTIIRSAVATRNRSRYEGIASEAIASNQPSVRSGDAAARPFFPSASEVKPGGRETASSLPGPIVPLPNASVMAKLRLAWDTSSEGVGDLDPRVWLLWRRAFLG